MIKDPFSTSVAEEIHSLQTRVEELLAALEEIAEPQDGTNHHDHCFRCRELARAAIAKAQEEA